MGYIFKGIFLFFTIVYLITGEMVSTFHVAGLLLLVVSHVFREKYLNSSYLIGAEALLVVLMAQDNSFFIILLGVIVYDLMVMRIFWAIFPAMLLGGYFLVGDYLVGYLFLLCICLFTGYVTKVLQDKEVLFNKTYDQERQIRYVLEETKVKLMNSAREMVHLTEIKERNRIAREIHDNVGHNLAGILLQLQAAGKLQNRDEEKAMKLMQKSIEGLAKTVNLVRDTVYNIKPRENLGIEYIGNIIDNFSFCPIEFKSSGDFNAVSPKHIEIICSNIKEALTNATRYSQATQVDINIDVKDKFTRLYIKDNGIGCASIKDGLGISGMKERVKNVGGSISISSNDGFLIVCILPRGDLRVTQGGGSF